MRSPINKRLIFILSFLGLLCSLSFAAGVYLDSAAAFALSGIVVLPFFAIYVVGVLDYKVGGTQLNLEKRVGHLETTNTELRKIISALVKAAIVNKATAGMLGGASRRHVDLLNEQFESIAEHIDPSELDVVNNQLKNIDEQIQKEKKKRD